MVIFWEGRKPRQQTNQKCPFTGGSCRNLSCVSACLKTIAAAELNEEERKECEREARAPRRRGPAIRPPMRRDGQMLFNTESRAYERRGWKDR
jgi:hypothetical protein